MNQHSIQYSDTQYILLVGLSRRFHLNSADQSAIANLPRQSIKQTKGCVLCNIPFKNNNIRITYVGAYFETT